MNDYWQERRQNQEIEALGEALAAAQSAARAQSTRLQSELSHVRGTIEQRLNRMARSFDAFVELSDLRALLTGFADPALARFRVTAMLDSLAGGALEPERGLLDIEDIPDYWLVPAAQSVHAALRGSLGAARERAAEACGRDGVRAPVFILLALGRLGGPDAAAPFADSLLPTLLPELPKEVRAHERELWIAAADGDLGHGAQELLRRHALNLVDRDSAPEDATAWESIAPSGPTAAPRGLTGTDAVVQRLRAAGNLGALRALLAERLAAPETALGSYGEPDTREAGDEPGPDPVPETLRLLVDEGTADEAPLLARVAQLREVIMSNGAASADAEPNRWDRSVGTSLELLRADAAGEGVTTGRGRIALLAFSPLIRTAADRLAEQAARPVEDRAGVSSVGVRYEVTSAGPDLASLTAARERINAMTVPQQVPVVLYSVLGVGAVAAAVAAAFSGSFLLWAVALGLVAGAAVRFVLDRRKAVAEVTELAERGDRLVAKAAEESGRWGELYRRYTTAMSAVDDDRRAVDRLLLSGA